MIFKNRKGSTLALTLIIFVVLLIFATFILSFMVTENKQAMYHQNKTQAYYIARSGADVVDSAIRKQLRTIFENDGSNTMNEYINNKLDSSHITLYSDDALNALGADSLDVKTSIVEINDSDVLAIDVKAVYNGTSESIRKVLTSYLTKSSSSEGVYEHQGLPIVAIEAAWRKDKDGKSDLSDPSKNNGKKYAEIVGEQDIFNNVEIPEKVWDINGLEDITNNPPIIYDESSSNPERIDLKYRKVTLSNDIIIDSRIEEINVYGDLVINARIETLGKVRFNIIGGLVIDGSNKIKSSGGSPSDIEFYVYYENSSFINNSLDIKIINNNAETYANFYVSKGKTKVALKKNIFVGDIASNDPFTGPLGADGLPINQNVDYNIIISSDDSSDDINFFGSVWAPDSYVVMGGQPGIGKNAIPQKGMLLGKFVEIDGLNHNKNFNYLNTILANSGEVIQVPGEIISKVDFQVLRFNSYYLEPVN